MQTFWPFTERRQLRSRPQPQLERTSAWRSSGMTAQGVTDMKSENNWRSLSAWMAGLALYAGLLYLVLASGVSKFYGFPVRPELHDLLLASSQAGPFLGALILLALERAASKMWGQFLHAPALRSEERRVGKEVRCWMAQST